VAEFTPTEKRILRAMSDGMPHKSKELLSCLPDDELGTVQNLRNHFSRIRKKLRPLGEDILCVIHNRTVHYRYVRLLPTTRESE
jgi:hypothetical protein